VQPDEHPPPEVLDGAAVGVGAVVTVDVAVGVAVVVGVAVDVGVQLDVGVGDVVVRVRVGATYVGATVAVGVGVGVAVAVAVASRDGDEFGAGVVWPVFTVCVPPEDLVTAVATPARMATPATEAAATSSHRFRSPPRRAGAGL
jgi:hypothetical protein